MTAQEFNALPWLLRRREVPGLAAADVRVLREAGRLCTVCPDGGEGAGRHFYYVRASLAAVLRLPMDWRTFEQWPELIRWSHLRLAGLQKRDIARLVHRGALEVYPGTGGGRRFYKASLGKLIGYEG